MKFELYKKRKIDFYLKLQVHCSYYFIVFYYFLNENKVPFLLINIRIGATSDR